MHLKVGIFWGVYANLFKNYIPLWNGYMIQMEKPIPCNSAESIFFKYSLGMYPSLVKGKLSVGMVSIWNVLSSSLRTLTTSPLLNSSPSTPVAMTLCWISYKSPASGAT